MRAKDYRVKAWGKLSGNWGMFALITLVESVIMSALSYVLVGTLLLGGPLTLGVLACNLSVVRGGNVRIEDMFDGFRNFVPAFVLYLLNGIFVFLWSLLLIIPGIIAELRYSMSFFILKDNPTLSGDEARRKSIEMMNGHKWELFCLRFSFIGWFLLSFLTLGILLLWVIPYLRTAEAEFYENLKGSSTVVIETEVESEGETETANND